MYVVYEHLTGIVNVLCYQLSAYIYARAATDDMHRDFTIQICLNLRCTYTDNV